MFPVTFLEKNHGQLGVPGTSREAFIGLGVNPPLFVNKDHPNASDTGNGQTPDRPFETIQEAIDQAVDYQTIWVDGETPYTETLALVYGTHASHIKIIGARGNGHITRGMGAEVQLQAPAGAPLLSSQVPVSFGNFDLLLAADPDGILIELDDVLDGGIPIFKPGSADGSQIFGCKISQYATGYESPGALFLLVGGANKNYNDLVFSNLCYWAGDLGGPGGDVLTQSAGRTTAMLMTGCDFNAYNDGVNLANANQCQIRDCMFGNALNNLYNIRFAAGELNIVTKNTLCGVYSIAGGYVSSGFDNWNGNFASVGVTAATPA